MVIGGSGFGEGRLAQEDVEELEQRRQDHGPQRSSPQQGQGQDGSQGVRGHLNQRRDFTTWCCAGKEVTKRRQPRRCSVA